jgi:hypothetical protein
MRGLPATLYTGEHFSNSTPVIIPIKREYLLPVWVFCSSPEFHKKLRLLNPKLSVDNGYINKIEFDLAYWQAEAERLYPDGVPSARSSDPTQWLFQGDVVGADTLHDLQVAMARLLGYCWPDQSADTLDNFAYRDGIVCLQAIGSAKAGAERLRELLAAAFGHDWSAGKQESLLAAVGYGGKSLHEWLRDGFFEQHCKLFHNRPFLWQIWDGQKDGFSAVVNYHKFDRRSLNRARARLKLFCLAAGCDVILRGLDAA